jgi:hypothetical protein
MRGEKLITRRDFLRDAACGAAGIALGLPLAAARGQDGVRATGALDSTSVAGAATSRVVLVRHPDALDAAGQPNGPVVARMLDDAVCTLLDEKEPAASWQRLLSPEDVLGIKTNVWTDLPTPACLEQAIAERAQRAGVSEQNIAIRDRGVLDDPVFQRATALINARPLRTHHWAGIGGCLKNYIMFVREPWQWHADSCADLGGLWNQPVCRGKTRLNVLVVLTPLFYGIGPHHFDPQHVWPYRGLLVGTDPVALDATGVRLLAEKRRLFFERPPRGGTSTKHVPLAETRHGIGVADPERIELVKIGWQDEALI